MAISRPDLGTRIRSAFQAIILVCAIARDGRALASGSPSLISIAELKNSRHAFTEPVAVRGSVTLTGEQLFIQDQTGALRLRRPPGVEVPSLGDEIEAKGTITQKPELTLIATSIRRLWGESMPLPIALDPDRAARGDLNGFLVQMEGRLLGSTLSANHDLHLTLQGRNQIYDAVYAARHAPERLAGDKWERDATLRLTGVLAVHVDRTGGVADAPFQLLLPRDEDVELVSPAPWWTGEHIAWLAFALLATLGMVHLRIQRVRAEKLTAVFHERSCIARDIHDTLAQGFAGITLQLETAAILLPRDQQAAAHALDLGLQMLRHSRAESHNAVRILRAMSRNESLDSLFKKAIDELGDNLPVIVKQQSVGEQCVLAYSLTNHLYHIGIQAMANALQHSAAKLVVIRVQYEAEEVNVSIVDNGRGFDPDKVLGMNAGHFGLTGMRERAVAISAKLSIHSALQNGTTITITAPKVL